jgi:hypothetical protein
MSARGRGRRSTAAVAVASNNLVNEEIKSDEKPKKVSKKKQFPVVAIISPDGIEGNLLPEIRKPLIVHLPIKSNEISFTDNPLTQPPCNPVPYDEFESNLCSLDNNANDINDQNTVLFNINDQCTTTVMANTNESDTDNNIFSKNTSSLISDTPVVSDSKQMDFYSVKGTLLVQYKDSIEVKSIPERSDAACFWCCHTFVHRPVVLPLRDQGEYLQVFGNFCCPECAVAYLFDMRQDSHIRWEQLAMLYRVYGDVCDGKIHPAPSRTVLKHFGGLLSIDEYRALIRSYKVRVDIQLPPMVSLLATMDTKPIDFYDTSLTKNVGETIKERLQKAEEVLRLRRTKPLKAWESTLDACINLKVRHDDSYVSKMNN